MSTARKKHLTILALALTASLIVVVAPARSALGLYNPQHAVSYGIRVELLAAEPDLILNGVTAMSMNWIAQDVNWAALEPSPGNYQWDTLDAALDSVAPYDIQILLTISGAPDWARPPGADLSRPGPPANTADFANFVGQLVQRYSDHIAAYEIWPGANTAAAWSSPEGLSPARYTELLRASRQAIKAIDPLAIVLSGGLTPLATSDNLTAINDLDFLAQMYTSANAHDAFDALGVRLTGYNNPPGDAPGQLSGQASGYTDQSTYFFRHYEQVYRVMTEHNDSDKAIWITGAGWASSPTPLPEAPYAAQVSETQQADYLVQAMEQISQQPYIDALIIDNFNFAIIPGSDQLSIARSLIRNDWSARPAFLALAQARQELEDNPVNILPAPIHLLPNWAPRLGDQ